MGYTYLFINCVVLFRLASYSNTVVHHSSDNHFKWLSPFDDRNRLTILCTEDNRQIIMHRSGVSLVCILSTN